MLYQTLSHTLKLAPHESPSRRTLNNYAIFYAKPSRKTLNNFGKPSTTLIIRKKQPHRDFFESRCGCFFVFLSYYVPHDFSSSRHSSVCLVYSVIPSSTTRLSSIDSASFDDIHYPVSHQIQLVNIVCRFHLDNLYHKNNYRKSIPHK